MVPYLINYGKTLNKANPVISIYSRHWLISDILINSLKRSNNDEYVPLVRTVKWATILLQGLINDFTKESTKPSPAQRYSNSTVQNSNGLIGPIRDIVKSNVTAKGIEKMKNT